MATGSETEGPKGNWRARLRVQQAPFGHVKADTNTATVAVDGTDLVLSGAREDGPLDSQEVFLNAFGFPTEEAARDFGETLRSAISVRSAIRRTGVDLGDDRPRSGLFRGGRELLEKKLGTAIRNPIHGLDVFEETGPVVFFGINPVTKITMTPANFVPTIEGSLGWVSTASDAAIEASQLLNLADQTSVPIARLSLAIAALERLAPPIAWSPEAAKALGHCVSALGEAEGVDDDERKRLGESVQATRDFGASGGRRVRELLRSRGLDEENKKHRDAARIRSKVLHGKPVDRNEVDRAATAVRDIVAQILEAELRECGIDPDVVKEAEA